VEGASELRDAINRAVATAYGKGYEHGMSNIFQIKEGK
jgi:hypothetical protein